MRKRLYNRFLKTVASITIFALFTSTYGHSLATLPASQNVPAKQEILAELMSHLVLFAREKEDIRILQTNQSSCIRLSSGKYLVSEKLSEDPIPLIQSLLQTDIKAILQIMAKENSSKYNGLRDLILANFPPPENFRRPTRVYLEDIVSRVCSWIILLDRGILERSEMPVREDQLLKKLEPIIKANRHAYFTKEIWDHDERKRAITKAIASGFVFYELPLHIRLADQDKALTLSRWHPINTLESYAKNVFKKYKISSKSGEAFSKKKYYLTFLVLLLERINEFFILASSDEPEDMPYVLIASGSLPSPSELRTIEAESFIRNILIVGEIDLEKYEASVLDYFKRREISPKMKIGFLVPPVVNAEMDQIKGYELPKEEDIFRLLDEETDPRPDIVITGKSNMDSAAVVLMACGTGSRLIPKIVRMSEKEKLSLGLADLDISDPAKLSKSTMPFTPIKQKSPIQMTLEALSAISRDINKDVPVVVIVDELSEPIITEMLRKNLNFGLGSLVVQKEIRSIPVIDESGNLVMTDAHLPISGGGGTGEPLRMIAEKGFMNMNSGEYNDSLPLRDWLKKQGTKDLIFLQTSKSWESRMLYTMIGAKYVEKKEVVVITQDYPGDREEKTDGTWEHKLKLGTIAKTVGPLDRTRYHVLEYGDRPKEFASLANSADNSGRVLSYEGALCFSMEFANRIIDEHILSPYAEHNKDAKDSFGNSHKVTKFGFALPDIIFYAESAGFIVADRASMLSIRTPEYFIESRRLKQEKDRKHLRSLGIKVGDKAIVEISPLAQFGMIGSDVEIDDGAKIYFGGTPYSTERISIENNTKFKKGSDIRVIGNGETIVRTGIYESYHCIMSTDPENEVQHSDIDSATSVIINALKNPIISAEGLIKIFIHKNELYISLDAKNMRLPIIISPNVLEFFRNNNIVRINIWEKPTSSDSGQEVRSITDLLESISSGDIARLAFTQASSNNIISFSSLENADILTSRNIRLALCDLEGTLVNNVAYVSRESFAALFWKMIISQPVCVLNKFKTQTGMHLAYTLFDQILCESNTKVGIDQIIQMIKAYGGEREKLKTVDEYYEEYGEIRKKITRNTLETNPERFSSLGAKDFLEKLHAKGVTIDINSAAPEKAGRHLLKSVGLEKNIDLAIFNKDWREKIDRVEMLTKEHGIPLKETAVFEDSPLMVRDIRDRFGPDITIVGIAYNLTIRKALVAAGADLVIDNFAQLELQNRTGDPRHMGWSKLFGMEEESDYLRHLQTLDQFTTIEDRLFPNLQNNRKEAVRKMLESGDTSPDFQDHDENIYYEQLKFRKEFSLYRTAYMDAKTAYMNYIETFKLFWNLNYIFSEETINELKEGLYTAQQDLTHAVSRIILFNNLLSGTIGSDASAPKISNDIIFRVVNRTDITPEDRVFIPGSSTGAYVPFISLQAPAQVLVASEYLLKQAKDDPKAIVENNMTHTISSFFEFLPETLRPKIASTNLVATGDIDTPFLNNSVSKIIGAPSTNTSGYPAGEISAFYDFMRTVPEQYRILKNKGEAFHIIPIEWTKYLKLLLCLKIHTEITPKMAYDMFLESISSRRGISTEELRKTTPFQDNIWDDVVNITKSFMFVATDRIDNRSGFVSIHDPTPLNPMAENPMVLLKLISVSEEKDHVKPLNISETRIMTKVRQKEILLEYRVKDKKLLLEDLLDHRSYQMPLQELYERGSEAETDFPKDLSSRRTFLEGVASSAGIDKTFSEFARVDRETVPIKECVATTSYIYNYWRILYFLSLSGKHLEMFSQENPPILIDTGDGYFISEGRHRIIASQLAGADTMEAAVIKITDPEVLDAFMKMVNTELPVRVSLGSGVLGKNFILWLRSQERKYGVKVTDVDRDIAMTVRLLKDILKDSTNKKRTYTLRYDKSKLSRSQAEVIEQYVDSFIKLTGNDVKIHPFSSRNSKRPRPILSISAADGNGVIGEGHINVEVPDGQISDYFLKLTGMLNIAFASSNIPENVSFDALNSTYAPLLGFIRHQYRIISGTELDIPESLTGILQVIKNILLSIPNAAKIPVEKLEEYNNYAKSMLQSA